MGNIDRLGFNSFFPNEEKKEYSEYAKGINSRMILQLASVLNTSLVFLPHSSQTQRFLLDKLLISLSPKDYQKIVPSVNQYFDNSSNAIINRVSNLKIIERELNNVRSIEKEDTVEEMTINFFKIYLLTNDEIDKEQTVNKNISKSNIASLHELSLEFFLPAHLPYFEILSKDFDFSYHLELSIGLMEYLGNKSKYAIQFQDFLKESGVKSAREYLYSTLEVLLRFYKMATEDKNLLNFHTIPMSEAPPMYQRFSGEIPIDYKVNWVHGKSDFTSIRSKPILKIDDDKLLVLDIPFLYDKIYQGLEFDFLGFMKKFDKDKKSFENTKSDISQNFSHKHFGEIVTDCFDANKSALQIEGIADCYLRQDKNVILFEFKDETIPISTKFEIEYGKIRTGIFEKFVWESKTNKPKGVSQLINAIAKLDFNYEEHDNLSHDGIHEGQISIYPVIVYTDMTLDFPGINRILNDEFQNRIKSVFLNKIGRVNGLILLNFKILLLYKKCFKNGSVKLIELFEGLYKEIDKKMMAEPYIQRDIESVFKNLTGSTQYFLNFIEKRGCLENESSFRQIVADLINENKQD